MIDQFSRRDFAKTGAAIGAAATLAGCSTARAEKKIIGANDRVRVGMIGVGNRGNQLLQAVLSCANTQVVAICDVYKPYLERASVKTGSQVDAYNDFRKLLDRSDIDAVVVATPDHWHAIQTIAACRAGKDVYVEKPLSITIHEGRRMVEVARATGRVVQVGTHRRSADVWKEMARRVQAGDIGKSTVSRAFRLSNMVPDGIGKLPESVPPSDLDWDMWLGPRPKRPYQENIAPYKFRWWQSYSSQMGNWGVHYLDAMRWCIGEEAPTSICAMGGRFAVDDDRTIPDTAEAMFEYASGHLSLFGTFEATGNPALPDGSEIEIRGTKGTATIQGVRFHVVPERGGQFQDHTPRMDTIELTFEQNHDEQTSAHVQNFFDCIKSREKPTADVEIGHRSTTMALLANISLAVKSRLEWDSQREIITNVPEANDLLHYKYRRPWTLD